MSLRYHQRYRTSTALSIGPYHLDLPMTVNVQPTGAIQIGCPCIRIGDSVHPVTLLLEFSPLAAKRLKQGLDAVQTLQDNQLPEAEEPTKQ